MKELISVVVPGYNVEKYISACVDSILAQSYERLEIILVDDGSTDGSPAIIDEYAKKDKRITVIHKENGGLSDARNAGIKKAKGKLITFIDSDDTVEKDYIRQLYDSLKEYDADISICGQTALYGNNKIEYSSDKKMVLNPKEALEKILYHEDFNSSSCAKLYKTSLFKNIRFPKGENYEDTSTTYRLILESKIISCNLRSQYNYIIRKNSIMTHSFSKKDMLLITSWDNMANGITERYPELMVAATRGRIYARLCALRKIVNLKIRDKNLEKQIRKEILCSKWVILNDSRCPKRDKIAIIVLMLGIKPFKASWNIYCKKTGRCI